MAADLILKGSTIITMDPALPRAEAVAVDTSTGVIAAVGTLADCQAAAPGVTPTDLGGTVLMPGFIEAHSHPALTADTPRPAPQHRNRALTCMFTPMTRTPHPASPPP